MSFILYALAGLFSGMLGGMGMGGGTILIPVLTIFFGVGQHAAQATNLIAFLPTALLSLKVHKDRGFIDTRGLAWIIIPAVVTSVLGSILAAYLPAAALRKLFGWFLIFLGLKGAATIGKNFLSARK